MKVVSKQAGRIRLDLCGLKLSQKDIERIKNSLSFVENLKIEYKPSIDSLKLKFDEKYDKDLILRVLLYELKDFELIKKEEKFKVPFVVDLVINLGGGEGFLINIFKDIVFESLGLKALSYIPL